MLCLGRFPLDEPACEEEAAAAATAFGAAQPSWLAARLSMAIVALTTPSGIVPIRWVLSRGNMATCIV